MSSLRTRQALAGATAVTCLSLGIFALYTLRATNSAREGGTVRSPEIQAEPETWRRYELTFPNGSYSGNPFELEIDAVFTHRESNVSINMPGYYAGNNEWKVSFMPILAGDWDYETSSPDPDLDEILGTVSATPSARRGRFGADPENPKKWRFSDGTRVIPIALRMEFFSEPASEREFEAAADFLQDNEILMLETRLTEEYGQFGGRHDFIFEGNWARHRFDLAIWDRMERRMDALADRGLGAHIMFYSDDAGRPGWEGRSDTEALVIRYVTARLAPYPVVVFNSGIDVGEYRSPADLNWWAAEIQRLDPYDHPVSSRHCCGSGNNIAATQTFDSRGDQLAEVMVLTSNYMSASVPVSHDDGWGENRGSNPEKDHTAEDIRRAAWKSLVAGGTGFLLRGGGDGLSRTGFYSIEEVSSDLESEQWLRHLNPFLRDELGNDYGDMEPSNGLVSGPGSYALSLPDASVILILQIGPNDTYDAGGRSISVDLRARAGTWGMTWVDPRTGNMFGAGTLPGGFETNLRTPSADDWALVLRALT